MSRLTRRLGSFLLATSLLAGACTPAMTRGPVDAGTPGSPIAKPEPRPDRSVDRARLRAALAERRQLSYQRFIDYRDGRIYPVNDVNAGFAHIWLDSLGNLCAAATIIAGDWGRDATAAVALENNFIALADVHDGPLADWILTSGLTHAEIVAIQVPGWQGNRPEFPKEQPVVDPRFAEVGRLYNIYVEVDGQLTALWDDSLDDAVDELMERPDLARQLIDGVAAGPGRFAVDPIAVAKPPAGPPVDYIGFAQPPP